MTNQEREGLKKRFLELIGKAVDKKISGNPKIKALIGQILVYLAGDDSENCKKLLKVLEELIDAIIKELKRQRLIPQAQIHKKTETKGPSPKPKTISVNKPSGRRK